jgi:molecular chaperone GrpE
MQNKKNNIDSELVEDLQESSESNEPNNQETDEISEKEQSIELSKEEQLEKEITELKDKQLRIFAEFENFKKRTAKERIDLFRNAGVEFFESMLTILDDFDRASKHHDTTTDPEEIKKGIDLIHSKLLGILNQKGLSVMDSSVGSVFDTDFHEAITQIPSPSKDKKGKVIDETEKGYLLNDKVIRYAKVVVGQ